MRAPLPRLARLALALGLFTSAGRAQDALTSEIERRAAALAGTVAETIFLGASTRIIVDLDAGKRVAVLEQNDLGQTEVAIGEKVTVAVHKKFLAPLA